MDALARLARPLSRSAIEVRAHRNRVFEEIKQSNAANVKRLEKMFVKYVGMDGSDAEDAAVYVLNKNISTPFNCAQHISEAVAQKSLIAMVDGRPFDMHRPLEERCKISFVHARDAVASRLALANRAFWRSCSFLLGMAVENCFAEKARTTLLSYPPVRVESGSFVYDISFEAPDAWAPQPQELIQLNTFIRRLTYSKELRFERQTLPSMQVALDMFRFNPFKTEQILEGHPVSAYRLGEHVDISNGPMIGDPGLIGAFEVAAIHRLGVGKYRFQGVALPRDIGLHPWTFRLLKEKAKILNTDEYRPRPPPKKSEEPEYQS